VPVVSSTHPAAGPLLVFGPRSLAYDFGPHHPLTPLRFGPGMDLLRAVGAEPGLAPSPAADEDLLGVHLPAYVEAVRAFSRDPSRPGAMGVGLSDNPAFAGMHEASAAVAGGSLAAMDAILRGAADHALHPGGGLHHAMASRAWGFCVYNDVALAVIRARAEGLRVLYIDLDVHHGDGVQAACLRDPGALTFSIHESGRYLFPQTGFIDELGEGSAAGTSVNLPLEPYTGAAAWLAAVRALVPTLAAVFGPDVVVSQHGSDSHAWDPLAQLRVTTTAMAEAARLVDAVAHRWAGGRWLATGGGGYDAYRVVPRAWALTWLAGAHREPAEETPVAWRERWEPAAAAFGTPGLPAAFLDAPNAGLPAGPAQETADERSRAALARVRATVLPRLVREAEDRGWWRPALTWAGREVARGVGPALPPARHDAAHDAAPGAQPTIRLLGASDLDRLGLVPRTIPPFDPADGRALLAAAIGGGARVIVAVVDDVVVGAAVAAPSLTEPGVESLLAVGIAPAWRGGGLGRALLRALVEGRAPGTAMEARVGVAERDVVEPADVGVRVAAARRLLEGAGFTVRAPSPDVSRDDRFAIVARLPGR
jgi:acetoin utilization protein AcuC